ncbi:MAG TPA: oxidoreductase, partial [Gammaproteobacteria bacterium]|nr:oxidoreductase [Gammaproteobacteria bacterium]
MNTVNTDTTAVDRLSDVLRGELLKPAHPGYEDARRLWNAMIDKHPTLIARCRDADDVMHAVNFARDHGLPLAVRGG